MKPGPMNSSRARLLLSGCCLALILSSASAALARSPAGEELARQLVELRGVVEELSNDLDGQKANRRAELRALAGQKADLELQLQREQLRLKKLRQAYDKHKTRVSAASKQQAELQPALQTALGAIRTSVQRGLPFKRAERLAALDSIEQKLRKNEIPPHQAASRMWQLVEDELRLARENGIYRQVITVEGQEVLAEVARLGMVSMYFRCPDGRVGKVERDNDGSWDFTLLHGEKDKLQIDALFDAFQKQIRVGFFQLPEALPPVDRTRHGAKTAQKMQEGSP